MRRYLLFTILLSGFCIYARGQSDPEIDLSGLPQTTTAKSLRYWFDNENTVLTTTTLTGATTIDASALKEGIHIVHYQIVDSKDIAGIPDSKMFIKPDPKITVKSASLRYWFDTDASTIKTTTTLTGVTTIDASALKEGVHIVHYQIIDNQGIANITETRMFFKTSVNPSANVKSLRYWFDDDMKNAKTTTTLSGVTTIDASTLTEGIHTLYYQTVDCNDILGAPVPRMFFKTSVKPSANVKSLRYWFDDDTEVIETDFAEVVSVATNKLKTNGTHDLHFQLVTDQGEVTPASTVSFEYVIPGDADGDGFVDVNDVTSTINYILNKPVAKFIIEAADMDKDGKIDVNDVQAIIYKALGK